MVKVATKVKMDDAHTCGAKTVHGAFAGVGENAFSRERKSEAVQRMEVQKAIDRAGLKAVEGSVRRALTTGAKGKPRGDVMASFTMHKARLDILGDEKQVLQIKLCMVKPGGESTAPGGAFHLRGRGGGGGGLVQAVLSIGVREARDGEEGWGVQAEAGGEATGEVMSVEAGALSMDAVRGEKWHHECFIPSAGFLRRLECVVSKEPDLWEGDHPCATYWRLDMLAAWPEVPVMKMFI